MKKMQAKSKEIHIYKANHKLPSNQAIGLANTKLPPPQRSKTRKIEGFGENVSQLPLCVSFLNMVSQEVVSHFNVFGSPMEN
jgi:hypothetical protein